MRTPEQIYKRYKQFATGVTKEEFINVVKSIQDEAFNAGSKTTQKQYYPEEEVDSLIESIRSQFSFNIRQTILQLYQGHKK
jgi:hypothetical protein